MIDKVRAWYEEPAHVDEMASCTQNGLKKWEAEAAKRFPADARILDVGCGMGREARALNEMGFSVTGIDTSREVIDRLLERGETAFAWYDGHTIPFPDGAFDVVIVWSQTFGLLYGDEYKRAFFAECRRVTADGGLMSYSGHDRAYLTEHYPACLRDGAFFPYRGDSPYWETFSEATLSAYAADAGLDVIMCGRGDIYRPEDGWVLCCLCEIPSGTRACDGVNANFSMRRDPAIDTAREKDIQ